MPKKGGKKNGGGKQMTEEEKLLYQRQKAQDEDERAKKKEDMLTHFLKDKLQKEEQNSIVNQHKLTQQWRAVLRQTRAAELHNEIAIFSQTFERIIDRKDSVMKSLMSDLNEAEQQSALALRSHLQCMDQLLEIHKVRLTEIELQWNINLEELSTEDNMKREVLMQHQKEMKYLEDVMFAMEQHYAEIDIEAKQDYQSTRDDIKKRNIEDKHALRVELEGKVEDLWQQFKQAEHNYKEATEDRRIAFDLLHDAEERSSQETDLVTKHLQKLQDSFNALRSWLSSCQKESEASTRDLQVAREEVTQKTQELKAKNSLVQAVLRQQLAKLTIHSNNTIKKLQDVIGKGEKFICLTEMCRKLETEQEKVLPFYESSLSAEELSQARAHATEVPSEELAQAMTDYTILERFWQRYNKVLLEHFCLEREEMVLQQENQQLRFLFKQYLDGISVSDEVLQQHNSLIVVSRPSLQASTASDSQTHKRHTVIEAAHVMQHTL